MSCTSIFSHAPWDSHAKWACASHPAVGGREQDAREKPLPSLSTPPAKTCRPFTKVPASQHMLIHNKESPAQSAELWNHLKSTVIYIYSFGGPRCLERGRERKEGRREKRNWIIHIGWIIAGVSSLEEDGSSMASGWTCVICAMQVLCVHHTEVTFRCHESNKGKAIWLPWLR